MAAPAQPSPTGFPAGRPSRDDPSLQRWLPAAAVGLLLLVTIIAAALVFDRRADAAREDRASAAIAAADRIEFALSEQAAGLEALGEVARRDDPWRIDRGAFRITSRVALAAGASVVHWAPRVAASEVDRFTATTGVAIEGRPADGGPSHPVLVSAATAADQAGAPVGRDLAGDDAVAEAIRRVTDAGSARATSRRGGLILVVPVYRGSTPGPVAARRGSLAGVAVAELTRADLVELGTSSVPNGARVDVITSEVPEGDGVSALDFPGVNGAVRVSGLDPSPWPAGLLLAAGLAVAAMVGALFLLAASREREGRRSSDAVKRERDYSAAVMSSIQDGLLLFDDQMRIVDINERASEITGFTKRELEGRSPPFPFRLAADRRRLETILEEVRVLGVGEFDVPLVDKEHRPLQAILSLSVKRDRAGAIEGYVGTIKDITARKTAEQRAKERERENRVLASQQRALREVATAVAREQEPDAVFALVASEAAALAEGEIGMVVRLERGVPRAAASIPRGLRLEPRPSPDSALGQALASGEPVRVRSARALDGSGGFSEAVVAPVRTGERLWGAVAVATRRVGLAPTAEDGVAGLAELVAMAIVNAQVRDRLTSEAATDPLTELANRRTFDERLASEVQRALRHERPLSLVMIDLDHFKAVNDVHGHQIGDEVLITVGRRISALARVGELVARVGGEEFAWILTETDANGAFAAAERARGAIRSRPIAGIGRVTVSAGVCDLASAGSAGELFRLADAALYQAKASGRDLTRRHSDANQLSAAPTTSSALIRARARDGLNSLARRIGPAGADRPARADAVADLVAAMANEAGWPVERVTRLREAARLYDVGLAGIHPALRADAGDLADDHRATLRTHVEIGANIASEVLDAEQVEWIRRHHERWDGDGYPDGLAGERIPDGARLIAVADAWVRLADTGPPADARSRQDALAACRDHSGHFFDPEAVAALERALQIADLS